MQHAGTCPAPGSDHGVEVFVAERAELGTRLGAAGLQHRAPVLVLVGGADGMDAGTMAELERLFTDAIAPLAEALGAYVVDGGTDAGVMRLMGRARAAIGGRFPLVGVVPRDALRSSAAIDRPARIEPHHSHVVMVPAARWEAAVPWLSWVADELAGGLASVTLLVNGGDVSWQDVRRSVQDKRPVIAVAGTGRAADALAAALVGDGWDPRAHDVLASGIVEAVSVADGPTALSRLLASYLTAAAPGAEPAADRDAPTPDDLGKLIEDLELPALQKHFLRSRWLDQVTWMSGKAKHAQRRYYALRLIVIIGGITIPMLGSLLDDYPSRMLMTIAGGLVAISAAVEEFFHYGERWRHYRHTVEQLKAEGWRFFQRVGPYQRSGSQRLAYSDFAGAVERLLEQDVNAYVSEIAQDRKQKEPGAPARAGETGEPVVKSP